MNNRKIGTIAIILVAVIALSIGFAAFSSTLKIESQAQVNPNSDDFSVVFSKIENGVDISDIEPTAMGGATGLDAKIDPTDKLKITNLNANFTGPNQSVTYEFYVYNNGSYDAYLRDVNFKRSVNGVDFISCTPGIGATPSLVEEACNGIKFELTIDGQEYIEDGTFVVQNLPKTTSKKVVVKISYLENSTVADGEFTVSIGDVALTYATTSAGEYPIPEDTEEVCEVVNVKSFGDSCTYQDLDSTNTITVGDKVTCGTESFYVIEDLGENTKVKMLAEWNLNISDGIIYEDFGFPFSYTYCESTEGYQDSHVRGELDAEDPTQWENMKHLVIEIDGEIEEGYIGYGLVEFDSIYENEDYGYWTTGDGQPPLSIYGNSYPAYVYDDNATIKAFVDDYTLLLNTSISGASATGRLINYEELASLGCSKSDYSCELAPSWVYQTSYWSGSARFDTGIIEVQSDGSCSYNDHFNMDFYGVRPVIEINASVINPA